MRLFCTCAQNKRIISTKIAIVNGESKHCRCDLCTGAHASMVPPPRPHWLTVWESAVVHECTQAQLQRLHIGGRGELIWDEFVLLSVIVCVLIKYLRRERILINIFFSRPIREKKVCNCAGWLFAIVNQRVMAARFPHD